MSQTETIPRTDSGAATPGEGSAVTKTPRGSRAAPAAGRAMPALVMRYGPYLVASILLVLGYIHYSEGAFFSLSERYYRAWAFPEFRYSDLIWLYLRDGLANQPIPYLDYPLEYPPLTGVVTFFLSFLPDLPSYYLGTYLVLAVSALATIWSLRRLPGANPWLFAAAPALFFYTGHQWDGIAIGVTALSLVAICRGREHLGTLGLAVGVSLKLFPIVFVAALVIDRLRRRQWRAAATIAAIFSLATVAFNLPVALADVEGWGFFFHWNRDRLADSGIWVLWRGLPTTDTTTYSLIAVALGGLVITALALRARGPLVLPLGATYLVWWMLVNKTFTTHLILWVFFAIALLGLSWWLWGAVVAADLVGFQLGNFLNLYNVPEYEHAPLIHKAVISLYEPFQIVRSAILLAVVAWSVLAMRRGRPATLWHGPPVPKASRPPGLPILGGMRPSSPLPRRGSGGPWRLTRTAAVWTAVIAAYIVATVIMTWPYAVHLTDSTVVGFDPLLQIWLSQWIQHALATNPLGLYDANIFHPFTLTLAYTDANIPGALLAWPLDLLTRDPILTNSLLVLASFVLAATGMFALVTEMTRDRAAGFVAGLAYAFIPYRMVHLWHLNWLQSAWLPWIAWASLRLIQRPTRRGAVFLGVLIAVQSLTSFYFTVQLAILIGIILAAALIAKPRLRTRQLLGTIAIALGVAAILTVPAYLPYLQVREEQGLERQLADAEQYKATLASYLQIAPWAEPGPLRGWLGQRPGPNESLLRVGQAEHADGHRHAEIVIEDALSPGLLATLGAIVAIVGWRQQRWLVVALTAIGLVAMVLSLGPSWGPRDGSGVSLPYRFLYDQVPFFQAMRVPARLGGLANLAIVALFGLGLATIWRLLAPRLRAGNPRRIAASGGTALLAGLVLVELYAAPIPLERVDRDPGTAAPYEWLATQPAGVVMEFPAESIFADPAASSVRRHVGLTMFWSTKHWLPMVNGSSGFIPKPYSDLIEAFTGELSRPDGTRTGRISHVSPVTVGLLRELEVRYLLFHRSRYQAEDWPAVEAGLEAAAGSIERVGDFDEVAIYALRPTVRRTPPPELTLWSPTLLTPELPWAPLVTVANPAGQPTILSLTEPATLRVTWYNGQGRQLYRGESTMPLPTVVTSDLLLCMIDECEAATGEFPDDLPAPEPAFWQPTDEGHYFIRIELDGDQPLSCLVDLDITDDLDAARDLSPKRPFRWGECAPGTLNPVNNPGAMPFRSTSPSITFAGGMAAVQVPLTSRDDEEVRGWFLLAPPDSAAPWTEPAYQSQVRQRLVRGDEETHFAWLEDIGGAFPRGVYGLTIWFHHREGTTWSHAFGGTYQLAPVVIEDGAARWAGPVRIALKPQAARFASGRTTRLDLNVDGASGVVECEGVWRLIDPERGETVAGGHVADCAQPRIAIPAHVEPGHYRLEIDVDAIRDDRRSLSDGLSTLVTVTDGARSGQPR